MGNTKSKTTLIEALKDIVRRATVVKECLENNLIRGISVDASASSENAGLLGYACYIVEVEDPMPPVVARPCGPTLPPDLLVDPIDYLAALEDLRKRIKNVADQIRTHHGIA